jgi:stress-induced morphogen
MRKKNLTTKATVHQHQTFPTNFIDLDEIMSIDEPTIIKRTRNVLSDSELSEMAQLKTKKGNAVEETTLMLADYRIMQVEFEKLNKYNQQRIINSIIAEKNTKVVYSY